MRPVGHHHKEEEEGNCDQQRRRDAKQGAHEKSANSQCHQRWLPSLRHASATEARELPRDVNLGNTVLTPCDWWWCLITRYASNMSRKADRQMSKVAANTAFVLAGGGSLVTIQTVLKLLLRRLGT